MSGNRSIFLTPRWLSVALLLFAAGLGAETLRAQETTLEFDPANTHVEFTLDATLHAVHGTFTLKSGTIHFDPSTGSASGYIVVDAASGDSGNKGRDHKMHQEILETQHYPEMSFTPTRMSGKVALDSDFEVQVEGIFRLHGADHPMTLTVAVQPKGNSLNLHTHIVIPYIAWGLKNPNTFLLHVSDKVEVNVTSTGRVVP
jgi:polyisoprenoid-binding protein YceI